MGAREVTTTINPNGSITVSAMVNGQREHMTYYFYILSAAIEAFNKDFPVEEEE